MRGKVVLLSYDFVLPGITPAYAGKRKIPQIVASKCRDHPRLCGEKVDSTFSLLIVRGSPPPMRGKVLWYRDFCPAVGITPAYAGKSLTGTVWTRPPRDHPRLCGEKVYPIRILRDYQGSPPPMRGKDSSSGFHNVHLRITPAYAGKSYCACLWLDDIEDHPRLCGEKYD